MQTPMPISGDARNSALEPLAGPRWPYRHDCSIQSESRREGQLITHKRGCSKCRQKRNVSRDASPPNGHNSALTTSANFASEALASKVLRGRIWRDRRRVTLRCAQVAVCSVWQNDTGQTKTPMPVASCLHIAIRYAIDCHYSAPLHWPSAILCRRM